MKTTYKETTSSKKRNSFEKDRKVRRWEKNRQFSRGNGEKKGKIDVIARKIGLITCTCAHWGGKRKRAKSKEKGKGKRNKGVSVRGKAQVVI